MHSIYRRYMQFFSPLLLLPPLSVDSSPSIWICMGMQNCRCCESEKVWGKAWAWEMAMDTSQDHKALLAIYILLHPVRVCTSESSRSISVAIPPNEKPNATVLTRSHENLCMQARTELPQDTGREIWARTPCCVLSRAKFATKASYCGPFREIHPDLCVWRLLALIETQRVW